MQIRPTNGYSGLPPISPAAQRGAPIESLQPSSGDQVELSFEAQLLANSNEGIRADRVALLKTQIASGDYETQEKIRATVDRILDEYA